MDGQLFGPRPLSLRWRLLRLVLLATLLIWGLAAALTYRQARHEVQELLDKQMVETGRLLLAEVHTDPRHLADLHANIGNLRGLKPKHNKTVLEYQVGRDSGEILVRSARAPETPLSGPLGFADITHNRNPWRSLILETPDGAFRIQIAHSFQARDKEAFEIARKTLLPFALFLPLMIALIYLSIRRGLKPLVDLTADVASRSPENLTPLSASTAPREVQPLVGALNRLLGRLAATLDNERRFTADAAHELRTPLAALKVQAQVAQATPDEAEKRHALAQVIAGADRTTRLIEQLLRLARLDPLLKLPDPQQINLADLAADIVANQQATAANKELSLHFVAGECPATISGDPDLLGAALRNLIDNALRYTPDGGSVTVCAGMEHGEAQLSVRDNGPGVPAEELPRLVERFYRGREAGSEGCGLGLAIVRRIAELHGARLEVTNAAEGGFIARLRWCTTNGLIEEAEK